MAKPHSKPFGGELARLRQVSPEDRVLIYFSGHGTQVPDDSGDEQEDDSDEVLVMHDTRVAGGQLTDFLRDDELQRLLAAIPSRNKLLLVDACNSGTVHKNLPLLGLGEAGGITKRLDYGYSSKFATSRSVGVVARSSDSLVFLSAASDSQYAQATGKGSVFTLGLSEAISGAHQNGDSLNPRQLQDQVAEAISRSLAADLRHSPQLHGPDRLLSQDLLAMATAVKPNWEKAERLVQGLRPLRIRSESSAYDLGDSITFTVDIPSAGYLNVINVGPTDHAVVLYPNQWHPRNRVEAGTLTLPTAQMEFDLRARRPTGESLTVVILSKRPINLYDKASKGRDASGRIVEALVELSVAGGAAMRSIAAEARQNNGSAYGGKLVVRVKD